MHYSTELQVINNKKVGILGGSFNPTHIGHLEMSKYALEHLGLDYVIWLVVPQNPLKPPYEMSLAERAQYARTIADDPHILVSSIEEEWGAKCTYDSLLRFCVEFPNTEFTWLMGADCLAQFHLWENFDKFLEIVNITIFAREGYSDLINNTEAGKLLQKEELKNNRFRVVFCENKLVNISSTEIRERK